ncbi:MAG: cysteine desulfurase family protein [Lachnospiraceae bacterium]|nr:cysteine desulfurase family protein [Lachnospiraceae bacterium]
MSLGDFMIYFDNAAGGKAYEEVCALMADIMLNSYGNPASVSVFGMQADEKLKWARGIFAGILNCAPNEIFFTSGGTESDNWALLGTARAYKRSGNRIITSSVEHPAVLNTLDALKDEGFEVIKACTDERGYIEKSGLISAIDEKTTLVSLIHVNNETGTANDIYEMGFLIKEKNPNTLFHIDAVQGFGKYRIDVKAAKCDMLSLSAHKFHGPRGVGVLYIKNGLKTFPIIYGGGQQNGKRSGTENTAGAAGAALAAKMCYDKLDENFNRAMSVKKRLYNGIMSLVPNVFLNGEDIEAASPYVLNLSFPGLKSQVLMQALEQEGIIVSKGSACGSRKISYSSVLKEMGLSAERLDSAIRFSFSELNTIEEADFAVSAVGRIVPVLRKYGR